MGLLPGDSIELRKARGAFFTAPAIAEHMAAYAINGNPEAKVLDPTCGEAIFLLSAGRQLKALGRQTGDLDEQLYGVDLHESSLDEAMRLLEGEALDAHLVASDFFEVDSPDMLGSPMPFMDAVVGNPPFVRYQEHTGRTRRLSQAAALRQGVRLSGLASSWAASLVHSASFLKPEGRIAMVLPAELLTVGYAEPVRTWLKRRFDQVHLVVFEELQFDDALEKVVLLLAEGTGGCESLSLHYVRDSADLNTPRPYGHSNVTLPAEGKWTDLLMTRKQLRLYKRVADEHFVPLDTYGTPELGTVTGANKFFTLSEDTRREYGLREDQLLPISPPGTKHLKGLAFTFRQWQELRDAGEAVWMLHPTEGDASRGLERYKQLGRDLRVDEAYKCQVRRHWWLPPAVSAPDLFFTYMSHRYPRLITNSAKTTFVNSMHGVRLHEGVSREVRAALPLLCLNSATMIGAERHGRSYGGGILKMEPREAARLPLPSPEVLATAWAELKPIKSQLDRKLRVGHWSEVVKRVDAAVLGSSCQVSETDVGNLLETSRSLRARRLGRDESS
jgi:hypothetical protein